MCQVCLLYPSVAESPRVSFGYAPLYPSELGVTTVHRGSAVTRYVEANVIELMIFDAFQ